MFDWLLKHKLVSIVFVLCFPVLFIFLGYLMINILTCMLNVEHPLIYVNKYASISIGDLLSLYLSIIGIIIGAFLTIGIFYKEKKEEGRKIKSIMDYYFNHVLIKNLNLAFRHDFEGMTLSLDSWIENSLIIKNEIDNDNFEIINDFFNILLKVKTDKKIDALLPLFNDFFQYYKIYHFKEDLNYDLFIFLDDKIKNALNLLPIQKNVSKELIYRNDQLIYKVYQKDIEKFYKFNFKGYLCDCSFKNGEPFNGYITTNKFPEYVGNFYHGKKNGKGKLVSKDGYILEEGLYQSDWLYNGKIYGYRKNTVFFNAFTYNQLHNGLEAYNGDKTDTKICLKEIEIVDYNVVDGKKSVIEGTERKIKVRDFSKELSNSLRSLRNINVL